MESPISAPLFAAGLFFGMLLCLEIGRRMGIRRIQKLPEPEAPGFGVVEGAVFAIFGLLIAFTFSGAATRFDARRALIAEEANTIGTAYLRLDLLTPSSQPALRELFRKYLDSRLETYRKLPDIQAALEEMARYTKLQGEIWTQAVAACRAEGSQPAAAMLVLPALNQMIDITTTRTMAARTHPPKVIFAHLFGLGLGCALLAGFAMAHSKRRSWIHILGFAVITAMTVFVILDVEYPRLGLIRVAAYDQVLVDLRESMR